MTPLVSVIIPTYKRKASVLRLLDSLAQQTLPPQQYEVIVVDDGSPDDTHTIAKRPFPFPFTYLRQYNQGATVARNFGVSHSRGDVLVFIDDDVTVSPATLEKLAARCCAQPCTVAMGRLIHRNDGPDSIYADIVLAAHHPNGHGDVCLDFVECNTELLAVRRDDFEQIGGLQDPTGGRGWPNWDDVDFGYRAYLQGYRLMQVADAVGEHWDYSLGDWRTACRRWQRASKSAVLLFHRHPGLSPHLPMLHDKLPLDAAHDSPRLIARKLLRAAASAGLPLRLLELMVAGLERRRPTPGLLRPLYRWIAGGYMYRGYRHGLREYAAELRGGSE